MNIKQFDINKDAFFMPTLIDDTITIPEGKLTKDQLKELYLYDYDFIEVLAVKIFREGTWNGIEYLRADIMEMALNYEKLKDTWIPSIKLSHDQGHFLTDNGKTEGNHGTISAMWESEGILYANMKFPVWTYIEDIKKERFNHKSVEIWTELDYNEVTYKNVISNVALLGISMPGCGNLGTIITDDSEFRVYDKQVKDKKVFDVNEEGNLMSEENKDNKTEEAINEEEANTEEVVETPVEVEETPEETPEAEEESEEMAEEQSAEETPEEEVVNEEPEATQEVTLGIPVQEMTLDTPIQEAINMQLAEMKKSFEAELASQKEIIQGYKKQYKETKVNNSVENLVKDGHIVPAQKELVREVFMSLENTEKISFSLGEEKIEDASILFERLLKTFSSWQTEAVVKGDTIDEEFKSSLPKIADTELKTKLYGKIEIPVDNQEESDAAKALQRKYAKEGRKVDFWDCYMEITKQED